MKVGIFDSYAMCNIIIIKINVYLSMSTQEYKGVTIKKIMHGKCKQ